MALPRRVQEAVDGMVWVAPHPPRLAGPLAQLDRGRIGQRPQASLADEGLVDTAHPAAVGRVDGRAERDRLAVHRAAGREDEVGERDEALRVDGAIGDDQRGVTEAPNVLAL